MGAEFKIINHLLMRKLSEMTGLEPGSGMDEALRRMEKGENPEQIEADMADLLEEEEPFLLPGSKNRSVQTRRKEPFRDETLYDMGS